MRLKIEGVRQAAAPAEKSLGSLMAGDVFAGTVDDMTGTFMKCDEGYVFFAETGSGIVPYFYSSSNATGWKSIANYKSLDATLTIKE